MIAAELLVGAIDSIAGEDRTPTVALVAKALGETQKSTRVSFDCHPAAKVHLETVRKSILRKRRERLASQQSDAIAEGRYLPYREPMDLGRRVTEIDIAKGEKRSIDRLD